MRQHGKQLGALGIMALLALGCSNDTKVTVPTCEITTPSAGALVTVADDTTAAQPGIQVNVVVRTTGAAGGEVALFVEGGIDVPFEAISGADGTHTFSGVTLPEGPASVTLACRVRAGTQLTQGPDLPLEVGGTCGLRFLQPSAGRTITRADTRTGSDGRPVIDVLVEAFGVEVGTPVVLEVGDAAAPQSTAQSTLSPTQALFEVPVYQGMNTRFFARALGGVCQPSQELRVTVDLGECATQLVPGDGTSFGVADDESPAPGGRAGLQKKLCVRTECPDGANAVLSIDGGPEQRSPVARGQACFDVTLGEGARTVRVRIESASQTVNAPPASYCVDLTAPSVVVDAPQTGVILRPAQDREPSTSAIMDILVEGRTGATTSAGCTVARSRELVELVVNGSVQTSFAPTVNGIFSKVARLPQGPNTLQVCATDQVGNRACSVALQLTVDLNLPTLRITSPAPGAKLIKSLDVDAATELHELNVDVRASGVPIGAPLTLEIDGGAVVCTGTVALVGTENGARLHVGEPGCMGLADGDHTLVVRSEDSSGNFAVSQEVVITVDNHPPLLAFTEPVAARVSTATVDIVLGTDAEEGRVVSLQLAGALPLTAPVTAGGASFFGVALATGSNTLTATVTDTAGNSATASRTLLRGGTAPTVSFTSPTAGQSLGASADKDQALANGFQFDVVVAVSGETAPSTVTLQVGDASAVKGTLLSGVATFVDVELAEGTNRLRATAVDAAGNVGTAQLTVNVSTGRPQVTLVVPKDGAYLSGSADADPSTPGIQVPVRLVSNAQTPFTSCSVLTDPGQVRWALTQHGATCSGVVTLQEGAHSLVATVESNGQTGRSATSHITIDATAPVLSFVEPAPGATPLSPVVFNAASADASGRPGFQRDVVVLASAIEAGARATLVVTASDTSTSYTASFDEQKLATFRAVTLPDQRAVTLVVTAQDLAGNRSTPVSLSALVDRLAPTVRFAAPLAGATFGLADNEGADGSFRKTVTLEVAGLEVGQPVTLTATLPNQAEILASATKVVLGSEGGTLSFTAFELPLEASGPVALTATARDRQGNETSTTIAIHVDLDTGTINWFAPSAAPSPTVVCASQDTDPVAAGVQYNVTLRTSGLINGSVVTVKDAAGHIVGRGLVNSGTAAITTTLPAGEADLILSASATRASGNEAATTDTRTLRVDTVGPIIRSFTCDGDRNGDGFLNKAENRTPSLTDRFEMSCTLTFADTSMNGRTVRLLSSAPAVGTVVGSATVVGTTVTLPVTLVAGAAPIGHQLSVSAADACNNAATVDSGVSLIYAATVDISVPTVAITAPTPGLLLAANDKVTAPPRANGLVLECCTGASGPYDITASVVGAAGSTATLKVGTATRGTAVVSTDGLARFSNIGLEQGALSLSVEVTDPAGNTGVSAPVAVTVDSLPPTIAITTPAGGAQLSSNTVTVALSYSDVEVGRVVEVRRRAASAGGTGAFTVVGSASTTAAGTLSVTTVLPQGGHELQALVSDVNGNVGSSAAVNITVTASDPVVTFESPSTNPAFFNAASGSVTGSQLTVSIVAQTGAAAGSTAVLLKNGTQFAGPVTVASVGGVNKATFSGLTLGTTETGNLQVRVTSGAGDFTSVVVPFTVDVVAPTLSLTSPACKAVMGIADADAQTPTSFRFVFTTDAESGRTVTVSTDALAAGQNSTTGTVASGAATTGLLALPQGAQVLTLRVSDRAGNERVVTCSTDVDTRAPTIPSFTATRSSSRRSQARLSWTMPGDNGTTGLVTSYALVQKICEPAASCTLATDAEFDVGAPTVTPVAGAPSIVTGGTAMTLDVVIPLQKTVTFALRAVDDAGNRSVIASASVNTAFLDETVAGVNENEWGASLRAANIDGDVLGDLIIGRPSVGSNGGAFRVIYGGGRTPTDVTAAQLGLIGTTRLGRNVDNAGDLNGDGYDDIIVGAPGIASSTCTGGTTGQTGSAFIFFGGPNGLRVGASPTPCIAGGSTDCYIALAAPTAASADQVCSFGQSVAGVGTIGTTAGARPMVAVGAGDLTVTSTRVGKVFVYSLSGTLPNITVNLVSTLVGGATDYHFGASVCGVRDVDGDSVGDLVVGSHRRGQSPPVSGRAYLVLGGSRFDSNGGTVTAVDARVFRVEPGNVADSFGNSCRAAGDLDGDGKNDFVVTASAGTLLGFYVVKGRADFVAVPPTSPATGFIGVTLPGLLQPGEISADGYDLDGDGRPDVVLGDNSAVYVFGGDAASTIKPTPIATFSSLVASAPTVTTGLPVAIVPNWKNASTNESALPDIAIGRIAGPSVLVKY